MLDYHSLEPAAGSNTQLFCILLRRQRARFPIELVQSQFRVNETGNRGTLQGRMLHESIGTYRASYGRLAGRLRPQIPGSLCLSLLSTK
jgi:hypothetical protein